MKNLVIFVVSFFVCFSCFAQNVEKRYFENNPTLGGDVVIKSASVKVENGEINKTFEIESLEDGTYYLDAWIMAPITKEGYPEYKLTINGVRSKFTLKPQIGGWQSLALTDAKKTLATVQLIKGINKISVIGKAPEIPNVEFVKLSSNLSRAGISDSNYKKFVESIKLNTLNYYVNNSDSEQFSSSSRGTNGEIYDYFLNVSVFYTTYMSFSFSAGQNVKIIISPKLQGGGNKICPFFYVTQFFSAANPASYSWISTMSSSSSIDTLNVTIPTTGTYLLRLRLDFGMFQPVGGSTCGGITTLVDVNINDITYPDCVVEIPPVPKKPVTDSYSTPTNFYTCKITDGGNTCLWLEDDSRKIRAYNDDGGTTSDGYSWGNASRITTNLTNISYAYVSSYSSNNPYLTCDLYMGLPPSSSDIRRIFPHMSADNSFYSGTESRDYNCVSWSVGKTDVKDWPSNTDTTAWNNYYESYGYTSSGATEDNAAIALWMNNGEFTHASVRKNSAIPNPHGFEWESKCGISERVMHTRDALNDGDYGNIAFYYRPVNGTVNSSPMNNTNNSISTRSLTVSESQFSSSDLNQIASLKNQIPATVFSDFETYYLAWENTWSRPEIAIYSNPYKYAESSEYKNMLKYCVKYGKVIWPLLIDKLAQNQDIFILNLLKDLTYSGKSDFIDDITPSTPVEMGKPLPSLYSNLVDYCKELLEKESANIQKSIQDVSSEGKDALDVNITTSTNQEILLSLNSEKEGKAIVKIYNIHGKIEYKTSHIFSKGSQTVVINTSKLKKGTYVIHITMEDKTTSQTINI